MANAVLFLLLCFTLCFGVYRKKRTYHQINKLLDCVLSQEKISYSNLREGEFSALVHKINRVQEILERQIIQANEEKEGVKSLVSDMSHQLKTPLANLSIYTEILSDRELEKDKKEEVCEKIKRQIDKLDWVTGSLMKMVRLEQDVITLEAQACSLRETMMEAIDATYAKIEKKGLTLISEPYDDCLLYHDRKWTAEVFVNLLENAIKYTDTGGTIRIRICSYEIYTEIQLIDSGCGIRKEEMTRIFQRFYRSGEAEQIEGFGIGLYLSNLILEKEKGYMTVKSIYGEGSCFSVFLQNCKNN